MFHRACFPSALHNAFPCLCFPRTDALLIMRSLSSLGVLHPELLTPQSTPVAYWLTSLLKFTRFVAVMEQAAYPPDTRKVHGVSNISITLHVLHHRFYTAMDRGRQYSPVL
ncbi:unnamed protein product [Periconia digitata]|uniref:Uncharacterized protein n=1 Tax=Periconia digitata TaxID=1303443 RepID=A0A9W4XJN2_9PLEO|nr:unnamed protein product [Periconia digitata]